MTTGLLTDIYSEMKSNKTLQLSSDSANTTDLINNRGVYGIHNRETGGIYIGSSNRSIRHRLLEHREDLDSQRHDNWRMMTEYKPENMEFRVFTSTSDPKVPEYVISVLEQIAISAFPMDILYNQNIVYPKQLQIERIREQYKDLLYSLVQRLRDFYGWQVNQCIVQKKQPRMLLTTLLMGQDLKLLNVEPGALLSTVEEIN